MPFKYEWDPGCCTYEEPEGITIWDLGDGRAPRITGQLHVLLLDNEVYDDIYLKHYTHTIHVDGDYGGREEGTPDKPFNSVSEANSLAWDGAKIKIRAGPYPESLTFSKRMEVIAVDGTVVIGE
jgi:hypothetical protein